MKPATGTCSELRAGADYSDIHFRGLRASNARIRESSFSDCVFEHCSLSGAEFARCSFTGCKFNTCDLSLARLPGTRLMDVNFVESKLTGVDWTVVDLPAKLGLSVTFDRCVLDNATFYGVNLRGIRLVDSRAREADFANADLTDAICVATDFAGARFADTDLTGADFRGAHGYRINPLTNRVAKAKFALPDAVGLLEGLGVVIE